MFIKLRRKKLSQIAYYSNRFINIFYRWRRRKSRRRRYTKQLKKHAESFFNNRIKKFKYYYKRDKSNIKNLENNIRKNQLAKKYKLGIRGLKYNYLNKYPLISVIKLIKRFRKNVGYNKKLKYKISVFPDFQLTAKSKSVRMGKGKGPLSKKIFFFKKGKTVVEIRILKKIKFEIKKNKLLQIMVNYNLNKLVWQLNFKLPFKNKIIKKIY